MIWLEKLIVEVRTMKDYELLRFYEMFKLYQFVFFTSPEIRKQGNEIIKGEIERRGLEIDK